MGSRSRLMEHWLYMRCGKEVDELFDVEKTEEGLYLEMFSFE